MVKNVINTFEAVKHEYSKNLKLVFGIDLIMLAVIGILAFCFAIYNSIANGVFEVPQEYVYVLITFLVVAILINHGIPVLLFGGGHEKK